MQRLLKLVLVIGLVGTGQSRPSTEVENYSGHWDSFSRIKDLIDRINIKKFRETYQKHESAIQTGLVEIDLTDEAIIEERVLVDTVPDEAVDAEATTIAAASDEATTLATAEDETTTAAAPAEEESPEAVAAKMLEAALEEAAEEINEVEDEFFVSEATLAAAKKFGYKILLRKVGGQEIPVGKIKFSLPTFIQVEHVTTSATESGVEAETTTTVAATTAAAVEEDVTTAVPTVASAVAPRISSAVVPEITEISTEVLQSGADAIVKDAEIAVDALAETKNELEISDSCSVPLEEIKSLVIGLARNIRDSTPLLMEIVAIGKSLRDLNDTASLLRNGGDLLKLLEPFLETILPATTNVPSCGEAGPNLMMISLSNVASEVDIVASNAIDTDDGKSAALHEAATSLQLAAWILAQLQQSVYKFFDQDGICDESETTSTTAILKTLAKTMESYKPMLNVLGPETGVTDLEDTISAINRAVAILESVRPDGGLPGVSCRATLRQMGAALDNLADFVTNLNNVDY